mgnify:CR=1 FL=1
MVLNYIWIAFFLIAFVVALCKLAIGGDTEVFTHIINASFASAKTGFEISLGLTGVLALWLGIMKIGEKGGVIQAFARLTAPVFSKLFPGIPKDHPATGSIFMCISANLLGLDNAATPMGLKAMKELQELNTQKDSASDPMIMFLCINASGLTLIPVSIMTYRAQMGAANPADVFLPLMLATFSSTLVAILAVCFKQRINILQRNLLLFFGGMIAFIGGLALLFGMMSQQSVSLYSTLFANILLFSIICGFIISGIRKKINVYDTFIEGAKEGFQTAVTIIPYLIAVLVAIAVFRGIAAASPSVWFPAFCDYLKEKTFQSPCVYLSLGDKEKKTRNPVMASVEDRIRDVFDLFQGRNLTCTLEWNKGNHFQNNDIRTAKAFAWVLEQTRGNE